MLHGEMSHQSSKLHNTDNNPYNPGFGIDADIDWLILKEF